MNNFKKLMLVAGFALLAACGGNADQFVGTWVESSPKKEEKKSGPIPSYKGTKDITIKASGSNEVEITSTIFDREKKNVYAVDGLNIISGTRVIYTLAGDELVTRSGDRLIKK